MPVDAFIWFEPPDDKGNLKPLGETQDKYFGGPSGKVSPKAWAFEIKDFNFEVENKTTIGSATGGAGAGKIQFGEFTIKKPTDSASPLFFRNFCAGMHYKLVCLAIRKAGGESMAAGKPYLVYTFGTVFTTKIGWSGPGEEEGPEEELTFAYGALNIRYWTQAADGKMTTEAMMQTQWNQITNKEAFPATPPELA